MFTDHQGRMEPLRFLTSEPGVRRHQQLGCRRTRLGLGTGCRLTEVAKPLKIMRDQQP